MNRRTILVVEDEPLLRLDATTLLSQAGLHVVDFANGDEAIDYLRDHQADVAAVFTDVRMPGDTDGLELAGIVAEACPQVAVLVTSGRYAARPETLHARIRYLPKPWLPLDVLTAMQDAAAASGPATRETGP